MEEHLDRVTEAYNGDLGQLMAQKTRKRIHWIANKVVGNEILDVGCSQGLVSILLGREGKKVTGVDISSTSIEYAQNSLNEEMVNTRENVQFIEGNFLAIPFNEKRFDTVIITEVLEHLLSSKSFLEKTYQLLAENGRVIITVPFGINDFPDHKRTFYLTEMIKDLYPYVRLEEVEFFGKWIGFIGRKNEEILSSGSLTISNELFERTEKAFFTIERELIDKANKQKEQITKQKEQITNHQSKNNLLQKEITKLKEDNFKLENNVSLLGQINKNNENVIKKSEAEADKYLNMYMGFNEGLNKDIVSKLSRFEDIYLQEKAQLKEAVSEIKSLNNQIKSLEQQNSLINKENQKVRERLEVMVETKIEAANKEKQQLTNELQTQEIKFNKAIEENKRVQDELRSNLNSITLQHQQLITTLQSKEMVIKELQDENKQITDEINARLSANIKETEKVWEDFSKELALKVKEVQEKDQRIELLVSEVERLKRDFEEKLEKSYVDFELEREISNQKIKELSIENQSLKDLRTHNKELEKVIASYEEKLSEQVAANNLIQVELNKVLNEKEKSDQSVIDLIQSKQNLMYTHEDKIQHLSNEIETLKTELLEVLIEKETMIKQLMGEKNKTILLDKKYNNLRNSKMGKLTLRYWEFKNKTAKKG